MSQIIDGSWCVRLIWHQVGTKNELGDIDQIFLSSLGPGFRLVCLESNAATSLSGRFIDGLCGVLGICG